jgi:hypothetical protein
MTRTALETDTPVPAATILILSNGAVNVLLKAPATAPETAIASPLSLSDSLRRRMLPTASPSLEKRYIGVRCQVKQIECTI